MKNKIILLVALCIVVALIVVVFGHSPQTAPAASTSASAAQLVPDVYPLYSGVQWGAAEAQELSIGSTTFSGSQVDSATIASTSDIAAASQPFEQYYASKLAAAGWVLDNSLSADGAGSSVTGYRKGSSTVVYGYSTVFEDMPANAPEQCPCDVTLHIFSSTQ